MKASHPVPNCHSKIAKTCPWKHPKDDLDDIKSSFLSTDDTFNKNETKSRFTILHMPLFIAYIATISRSKNSYINNK